MPRMSSQCREHCWGSAPGAPRRLRWKAAKAGFCLHCLMPSQILRGNSKSQTSCPGMSPPDRESSPLGKAAIRITPDRIAPAMTRLVHLADGSFVHLDAKAWRLGDEQVTID